MLQPKRTKFRKMHKGRIKGLAKGGSDLNFGTYGLKALEPERVTARQIEAARQCMVRHIKRGGNVWLKVYPDKPLTKKPAEVRMGKGKGSVEVWVAEVKSGRIMYEITGVAEKLAVEALELAAAKLPQFLEQEGCCNNCWTRIEGKTILMINIGSASGGIELFKNGHAVASGAQPHRSSKSTKTTTDNDRVGPLVKRAIILGTKLCQIKLRVHYF